MGILVPAPVADRFAAALAAGSLDLPLLPDAAVQIMSAAQRDDAEPRTLAMMIGRDPALTGHVLRIVNSPLYAANVKIVSLQQAVSRLGMRQIREIAVVIGCQSRVFKVSGFEVQVRQWFRHSLAAAMYARDLARARRANVEEAFLAGLLHDVGRPLALQLVIDLHREKSLAVDRAAVERFVDEQHAQVGAATIERWGLPARTAEAVRAHHTTLAKPAGQPLHAVVQLADAFAHHALDEGADRAVLEHHPLRVPLDMYPDELERLIENAAQIRATVEEIA